MASKIPYEFPATAHRTIGYPYRVWIFTILLFPLVAWVWGLFKGTAAPTITLSGVSSYFVTILLLTALGIPFMIIYLLLFTWLVNLKMPVVLIKFLLALFAITLAHLAVLVIARILFHGAVLQDLQEPFLLFSAVLFMLSLAFSLEEK